jgi:hypothetical protein
MSKRAVDLSAAELSAMGAKAARLAAQKSQAAGQVVTGTVEVFEGGGKTAALAQLLPSGTVALVEKGGGAGSYERVPAGPVRDRTTD